MRRALASLLLVVFSFPLIAPALTSNSDAQLPACCRRDGRHRCSMLPADTLRDLSVQAVRPRCPYSPASNLPGFSERNPAVLRTAWAIFLPVRSNPVHSFNSQGSYYASPRRSHHKRGPPSLIS